MLTFVSHSASCCLVLKLSVLNLYTLIVNIIAMQYSARPNIQSVFIDIPSHNSLPRARPSYCPDQRMIFAKHVFTSSKSYDTVSISVHLRTYFTLAFSEDLHCGQCKVGGFSWPLKFNGQENPPTLHYVRLRSSNMYERSQTNQHLL